MIELHNVRYLVEMGCGIDYWRLSGEAYGHPQYRDGERIWPSTPVSFDEEQLTFQSASGKSYQLCSFEVPKEKVIEQLKKDIKKGGYERC